MSDLSRDVWSLCRYLGYQQPKFQINDTITAEQALDAIDFKKQNSSQPRLQKDDFIKADGSSLTFMELRTVRGSLANIFTSLQDLGVDVQAETSFDVNALYNDSFDVQSPTKAYQGLSLSFHMNNFSTHFFSVANQKLPNTIDTQALLFTDGQTVWDTVSDHVMSENLVFRIDKRLSEQKCENSGVEELSGYGEQFCEDMHSQPDPLHSRK